MVLAHAPALRHAVLLFTVVAGFNAVASQPSAFDLIQKGDRYVGEQSKDKVVQIRSEKSVEVKFGAGEMMSVKRPLRLLEPVTGGDMPLDRAKLKIDSDEAVKIALKQPLLENLKVVATQLKLERSKEALLGEGAGEAVWKVKLWAAKLRNPNREADVGEVWITALDGKVVKNDLHINRVD